MEGYAKLTPHAYRDTQRLRVYVAGAYSAPNVIDVLANMRKGLALSHAVLKAGFAPFAPWLDFQYGLIGEVTLDEYRDMSMAWLEAADAVLVQCDGAELSQGTQAELKRAGEKRIPIFWRIGDLIAWQSSRLKPHNPQ